MKTGWKITIEATAISALSAYRLVNRVLALSEPWYEPRNYDKSTVNGSASVTWEKIELPDVEPDENL